MLAARWLRAGVVRSEASGDEAGPTGEPASLGRRLSAGLLDGAVVALLVGAAIGLTPEALHPVGALAVWFLGVPVAYFAALEATLGWTPGKQLLGLRVTDSNGAPAGVRAAVARNLLRPVDALLGFLLIATDEGRLGDRVAGTDVRRLT